MLCIFAFSSKFAFLKVNVKVFSMSGYQNTNNIEMAQTMILGYYKPYSAYWFKKRILSIHVIIVKYITK